ncbi:MAG: ACT domain-containing protein [Clostridiales bacterium]|jgi:hypothetical protein|nr:ACT domain-containing protein [Clostridiales bacterium]
MILKQISVFVENRYGAIRDITKILADAGINIRALSVADTTDFGVVRMIVDKRKPALKALRENGMTVKETDVIALVSDDRPGSLYKALCLLAENEILVEYSYGFVSPMGDDAIIILKCDDMQKALSCLTESGFKLLTAEDVKF